MGDNDKTVTGKVRDVATKNKTFWTDVGSKVFGAAKKVASPTATKHKKFWAGEAQEHRNMWTDRGSDTGVAPRTLTRKPQRRAGDPNYDPKTGKALVVVDDKPEYEDAGDVVEKTNEARKESNFQKQLAHAKAKADRAAGVGGGPVRMTKGGMLPHIEKTTVKGAVRSGPMELAALREYLAATKGIADLKAQEDPRIKASAELQGTLARLRAEGAREERSIQQDDEAVLGILREKAQHAYKNAEYNVDTNFGKKLIYALVAIFGGDSGMRAVGIMVDKDVKEAEGKYQAALNKAKGAEGDAENFARYSQDAGKRRQEMRLERLLAAVKISEAYIARLPNNDQKIKALEARKELWGETASVMKDLYRRNTGEVTVEESEKYHAPKAYGGGGKKEKIPEPFLDPRVVKEEDIERAGSTYQELGLADSEPALADLVDLVNEGLPIAQRLTFEQTVRDPTLFNKGLTALSGLSQDKQSRAIYNSRALVKAAGDQRVSDKDAEAGSRMLTPEVATMIVKQLKNKRALLAAKHGKAGAILSARMRRHKKGFKPSVAEPSGPKQKALKRPGAK